MTRHLQVTLRRFGGAFTFASLAACGGSDTAGPTGGVATGTPIPTIVYSYSDGTNVNVMLTNLDGTSTRAIPCPELYCVDGELSPDGKQLIVTAANAAFVRHQYVMGTDGSNPRLVTSTPVASMLPTWKHDGKAFYSYSPTGNALGSRAYVTDVTTGASQPIEPTSIHSGLPTESPDGKRLVFASARRGFGDELYSLDLTSGTAVPVQISIPGLPTPTGTANQPRYSPSGAQIAFTYTAPNISANFDIWIINADGTNAHPFMNSPQRELMPDWSPDGAYIVFVRSPALNVNEIVIARTSDGTVVRTIAQPASGSVNYPRWGMLR